MDCNKGFSSSYMILKPEEVKLLDLIHILFSTDIEKRKFVDADSKEADFERRWIIFISIVAQKLLQFLSKPLSFVGSLLEMWLNLLSSNGGFCRLLLNVLREWDGFCLMREVFSFPQCLHLVELDKLENYINNGVSAFYGILLSFLKRIALPGKVANPDKTSASFVSFIGNFDKRIELDRNIKHEDARYYAALSMMASKASYENKAFLENIVEDHWKMEFLGFYDFWNDYQDKATTQAFLFRDKSDDHDTIVVAFRGTEPFDADAWCSDFDISWYELPRIGRIHGGFMKALGLQKCVGWPVEIDRNNARPAPLAYYAIRQMLKDILSKNDEAKFILTGHSLGGALAILFPTILELHEEKMLLKRLEGIYTFGQPRIGDEDFGKHMEKMLEDNAIQYCRLVYGNDIVPRLPYDDKALMFKHFGTCIYYNRHYEGKVVTEEPNKNYFSPHKAIPMIINAIMELIRSFTISKSKGVEYKEGGLMRLFRVIGLALPGVPAHCPQDYVNATRLGSAHVFLPPHQQELATN